MNKTFKNISIYLLIVLLIVGIVRFTMPAAETIAKPSYSELLADINADKVKELTVQTEDATSTITGKYKDGTSFETVGPSDADSLVALAQEHEINYLQEPPPEVSWWASLLGTLIPMLIIVFLFVFLMQQSQGGGGKMSSFGRSRARLLTDEVKKVTFDDVAGADEVKEEMEEIVEFLKSPKKFTDIGARIPKGVLLFGPPGTGKTLIARAVAGEAGVPFFSISGSDFVEMFVGVGASRVRDLFEEAKKKAPCIVFIDEIDAVGRQRGAGLGGGHDEREQTLNQLLVEMDGFSTNESIIVIAATNRPDILDPALLRPGRFDRQVVVDRPDVGGREDILKVHVKGKSLDEDVDLKILAKRTPGFTGADLANLVNEGALLAARKNKKTIAMEDLENAIERVIAGPEKKSKVVSEKEKKLVSYHEAGHALVAHFLDDTDPVHKISIIPRGRAGGYTLTLPEEDRNFITKNQMTAQIALLMGGRVAEALILKDISTGASNDLERATSLARSMVMQYGMSDKLGPMTLGRRPDTVFLGRDLGQDRDYSEEVAYEIDKEVRRIVEECYDKAETVLTENLHLLHLVAQTLMEKETIEAEEFKDLLQRFGGYI